MNEAPRQSLITWTLAAALAVPAPTSAQTPRFNGEVFDTGSTLPSTTFDQLGELALFDVDQDGQLDAIVDTNIGLVLMSGTADGAFIDPQPLGVNPSEPIFLVADLENDGTEELLAVGNGIYVLSRDGLGGLNPIEQLTFGPLADSVTVLDLDGDGDLDVVGGDFTDGSVTTWFQGAGGSFSQGPTVDSDDVECLAAGDMDGDGDQDVVVTTFGLHSGGYRLTTWLNDGSGALTPGPNELIGLNEQTQVVDLDEDGTLDVVAPSQSFGGGFRVLYGDGTGGFAPWTDILVQGGIDNLFLTDVDGDGQLDLLGTVDDDEDNVYGRGQNVFLRRGLGGGAFAPVQEWNLGPSPVHVAVADVDGQGALDLVVSIPLLAGLAVLHGELDGGLFAQRIEHVFPDWTAPSDVASADLDQDGDRDLLVVTDQGLVSLLSDGGTGLTVSAPYPVGFEPRGLDLGDLDGDGVLDAVVALPGPDKVSVRLGDGAGSWLNTNTVLLQGSAYDVALADLTGDGLLDLVAASTPPEVAVGLGNGLFGPAQAAPGEIIEEFGGDLGLADLDGDGHLDLVTGTQFVEVRFGDGTGALSTPTLYDVGLFIDLQGFQVELVDVDRDTDPDMVLVSYFLDEIVVLLNDGTGTFLPGPVSPVVLDDPGQLAVADLTGDGLPDVLVHTYGDGIIHLAPGAGDGSFGSARRYLTQGSPHALQVDDVDGDLRPDVLVTTYYKPDTVAVLRNLGPEPTWASLDGAIPGSGAPLALEGSGSLQAGSATELRLLGGQAFTPATLVVGFAELSVPFKGGLLVPTPDLLLSVPLDGSGALALQTTWPAGVPSSSAVYWQGWQADGGAPLGLAASNGLRTLTP